MKKFLVLYVSRTGKTKQMAEWIAEGLRFAGHEVDVMPLPKFKDMEELKNYDGVLLGSPTYHKAMLPVFENWLFKAAKIGLEGKFGGAFGSHTHSGEAPVVLHDTMNHVFKMNMLDMGPLKMEERFVNTDEGMRTCQQFGRSIGERAGQ